jgi:hypothetical protein
MASKANPEKYQKPQAWAKLRDRRVQFQNEDDLGTSFDDENMCSR